MGGWRDVGAAILTLGAGIASAANVSAQAGEPERAFDVDNRVMCAAEYHIGRWVPGDPDAPPGILIEFR